jgi:hypothetical protein
LPFCIFFFLVFKFKFFWLFKKENVSIYLTQQTQSRLQLPNTLQFRRSTLAESRLAEEHDEKEAEESEEPQESFSNYQDHYRSDDERIEIDDPSENDDNNNIQEDIIDQEKVIFRNESATVEHSIEQEEPIDIDQQDEKSSSHNEPEELIDEQADDLIAANQTNSIENKSQEEEPIERSKDRFDESLSPLMDNSAEDVFNKPLMANDLFDLSSSSSSKDVCEIEANCEELKANRSNHDSKNELDDEHNNQVFCIDETYLSSSSNSGDKQIGEHGEQDNTEIEEVSEQRDELRQVERVNENTVISLSSSMNEEDEDGSENNVDFLDKNLDMLDSSLISLDDDEADNRTQTGSLLEAIVDGNASSRKSIG